MVSIFADLSQMTVCEPIWFCTTVVSTVFFRKEPLFDYYYLPHNWRWFAPTRSSPLAAPPEGGTWTCVPPRDTSSMRRNSLSTTGVTHHFYFVTNTGVGWRGGRWEAKIVTDNVAYIFWPKQKTRKMQSLVQITLLWLAKFGATIQAENMFSFSFLTFVRTQRSLDQCLSFAPCATTRYL